MKNKKTLFSKKFLTAFLLTMMLTFSAQPAYAWLFMGVEEESIGYTCDGFGNCYEGWITRTYVFGICIRTEYSFNSCNP
ncbi:MAG: hypothetical protein U0Y10_12585 [Spirosomataceae bacterium]